METSRSEDESRGLFPLLPAVVSQGVYLQSQDGSVNDILQLCNERFETKEGKYFTHIHNKE